MTENNYLLHIAAEYGHYHEACRLLEAGIDINEKDLEGYTSLHKAVQYGYKSIVELLLEKGAHTEVVATQDILYPIHLAAKYGHLDIVDLLLKNGACVDSKSHYGDYPIHLAAEEGHIDVIDYFLDNGIHVDTPDYLRCTPLHRAVICGKKETVEFLLTKNANINQKQNVNNTSLHLAAFHDHEEIVKLLIEKGANVNETNINGWTVLHFVVDLKIIGLLLEAGAICKLAGISKGFSVLHRAAGCGRTEIIEYFFEKRADPDFQTTDGYTLLHAAVRNGHTELVQFLLDKGADINAKTHSRALSSLYFAALYHHSEIIDLLIQNDALFDWDNVEYYLLELIPRAYDPRFPDADQYYHEESAESIIKYVTS